MINSLTTGVMHPLCAKVSPAVTPCRLPAPPTPSLACALEFIEKA